VGSVVESMGLNETQLFCSLLSPQLTGH